MLKNERKKNKRNEHKIIKNKEEKTNILNHNDKKRK